MTEELEKAWRSSARPFHNDTVYTEDPVPIASLQPFVSSILQHISFLYGGRSFFLFDDWHAHDGFIVPATPVSIGELAEHVATVDSLYNWRQGDFEFIAPFIPKALISYYASTFSTKMMTRSNILAIGAPCLSAGMDSTFMRFANVVME